MQNEINASDYKQLLYEGSYNPLGLFYLTNKKLPNVLGFDYPMNKPDVYTYLTNNYKADANLLWLTNSSIPKDKPKGGSYCIEQLYFDLEKGLAVATTNGFLYLKYDVMVLYTDEKSDEAKALIDKLTIFKSRRVPKKREIKVITFSQMEGFEVLRYSLNKTRLQIATHYNDDFIPAHEHIVKKLKNGTKGIILLYGEPGTGKTNYLRYLAGIFDKKDLIYIPSEVATRMGSPDFFRFLLDIKNTILLIEDAESVIESRDQISNMAVSNILNISDGLLSDILNIQLVCTFNNPISKIDPALLRKGRIIVQYEFKKLAKAKAQALSDKLGHKTTIRDDTSLADIYNQDEPDFVAKNKKTSLGFNFNGNE